ncbi:MAG: acetate--CoA ligase family protein, partial [Alphaproteobacteria bacterium]|nr:acetate--CoA ligase family protein [Alphaproteobacteria bacterium]
RVDLAVLIIPAEYVPATLEQCGQAGVRAAQIITSGFAEDPGTAGSELQDEIRRIAERHDMAVCGPNAEGFANTQSALCPTFSPAVDEPELPLLPPWSSRGHIAVVAQSGGMGFAFYDRGRPKELPFSYIVTTGNEACLESLDIVDYMLDEGRSDVFILFMEDLKRPERFAVVAEKALRAGKPIIVTKIGASEAGVRAAASHTAALAGSHAAYQAMFRRYGVIEGDEIEEMVDIAAAFSYHGGKLPVGNRVGICTTSGGAGGWMADACAAAGLEIPELDAATRATVDGHLPSYGTSQNPVDATAQAVRKVGYAGLAEMVGASDRLDSLIMVTSARNATIYQREREALADLSRQSDKPILFCSYTLPHPDVASILGQAGLPLYTNMPNCARAVAELAHYRRRRERFLRAPAIQATEPAPLARVGDRLRAAGPVLCEYEVKPLLAEYGIAVADDGLADSADRAVELAAAIDGPVALKLQSPNILHKTEAGALALNLADEAAVRAAYGEMIAKAPAAADLRGVLVQPMAPAGHEMIVGVNRDETFGPLLMLGFGGVHVEVTRDVALSPVPIDEAQAAALLDGLRGRPILDGVRGQGPADQAALLALVVAVSRFAADHGELIGELDLNPVLVHAEGKGVSLVDALLVKR